MLRLAVVVFMLMLAPASVEAARPQPTAWFGPFTIDSEQGVVEQQSPSPFWLLTPASVVNPDLYASPPCSWDVDDQQWASLIGLMKPGETFTTSLCLYADWGRHLIAARSFTDGVEVTVTLPGHVSRSGSIVCIVGPDYWFGGRNDPVAGPLLDPDGWLYSPLLTEPVPGSNGGVAHRVDFAITATNMTGKRIRNAHVEVRLVLAGFSFVANEARTGCPWPIWEHAPTFYPVGHDPQVWVWVE